MKPKNIRYLAITLLVTTSLIIFLLLRNSSRSRREAGTPALPAATTQAQDDPSSHHPNVSDANDKVRMGKLMERIRLGDVPIKFFGMVVDQDETPLSDAKVCWRVGKSGYFSGPPDIKGTAVTNASGVFSLAGESGRVMNIERITKDGYRQAESAYYGWGFSDCADMHIPDSKHPVIFLLVKDELPKVKYIEERGIPLVWNKGLARVPLGFEELELLVTATRVRKPQEMRGFAWNVEISMNHAELFEIKSGEAPLAPKDGYQKMLRFGCSANDKFWKGNLVKKLAIKTSSGLFGKVVLDIFADREDDRKAIYFSSGLNMVGKRNLK